MNPEILKSYLVNLGFSVNNTEFQKFDNALRKAGNVMQFHTSGIIREITKWDREILKFQSVITGAFAGVSGAVLGLVDHVAMADQGYRLLGLRMFMTQDSAKKLDIALKALGATQEEVAFDPELHGRFLQLMNDQNVLQKQLGGNFRANMIAIRDLRFEFTRLHVALQYLAMGFVNSLFKAMGTSADEVKAKIEAWISYLQQNLKPLSDQIAKHVAPILKEFWQILKAVGGALEQMGVFFTNVVGLLSGDDSIMGTTGDFDKFGKAVEHVAHGLAMLVQWITLAERMLLHLGNAAVLALGGHVSEAMEEFKKSLNDLTPQSGGIAGVGVGGTLGSIAGGVLGGIAGVGGGPLGVMAGIAAGTSAGGAAGAALGGLAGAGAGEMRQSISPSDKTAADWQPVIETQKLAPGHYAPRGIRNNNPGNLEYGRFAQQHGAIGKDPRFAVFGSAQEGLTALADLLRNYQQKSVDTVSAIISKFAPANENNTQAYIAQIAKSLGVGANDHLDLNNSRVMAKMLESITKYENGLNPYSKEMIAKAAEGRAYMDRAAQYPGSAPQVQPTQNVTVEVGGIHIMQPNATPAQIEEISTRAMTKALKRDNQITIAQLSPAF